jgi:hypothetical protein
VKKLKELVKTNLHKNAENLKRVMGKYQSEFQKKQ